MRRTIGLLLMLAFGIVGGSWGATASAQADVTTFCQSRSNLAAAISQQDEAAVQVAFDAMAASAPAEVQEPVATLATLLAKRGPAAFETKKGGRAARTIDDFVAESCGFPVLEVSAIDYEFLGISGPLTAGPYVIDFTNDAPKEHHEMVLLRAKPGVTLSVKKVLALSEKKLASKAEFVGAAFAEPDDTDILIAFLEPGRYIYACFIDVGTTSDDAGGEHGGGDEHGGAAEPHWAEGMRGELEVVGGA